MNRNKSLLDSLIQALDQASEYNKNDQTSPIAVLWPDEECQWLPLIPLLRPHLPLLTLGTYQPEEKTGPAYWLRCMIDGTLPEASLSEDSTPIVYLPGFGKDDLRAIEDCPKPLQPLAELQYRGLIWVHRNGRDWTVSGFLHSLGITVGANTATKEALARALPKLAIEPVDRLKQASPLKSDYFNQLLHPDAARQMLLWLDDPAGFRSSLDFDAWQAFCALSKRNYDLDPEKDGPISAAAKLGLGKGSWKQVWLRFGEAPNAYPNIPQHLRQARPNQPMDMFTGPVEGWPQDNEAAESGLRTALIELRDALPGEVRGEIARLEAEHSKRREWIWAHMGKAPLAQALTYLNHLAQLTERPLGGSSTTSIAEAYTEWGWEVDAAVTDALNVIRVSSDLEAVKSAILPMYRPWLENGAKQMQQLVVNVEPVSYHVQALEDLQAGDCILFSDALRYDVGQRLVKELRNNDFNCNIGWNLAALPSVTATAKPAVSPVASAIIGGNEPSLTPVSKESLTKINANVLRRLIAEAGHQVLLNDDLGDPTGTAWTEWGAIDRYGHDHGWKIAQHLASEINSLADRVYTLLNHGWHQIIIVTDHGWLMLPEGLPKADLPQHLTTQRKGRCAVLKEGANTDQQTVSWFWNPEVRIAIAPNLHCYEAGKEYEHGGISPQECIVPIITVSQGAEKANIIGIEDVSWRGLRCYIQLSNSGPDIEVDIRLKAADAETTITDVTKKPDEDGFVSLIIPNEDLEGEAAFVVVTINESLRAQRLTVVGGS